MDSFYNFLQESVEKSVGPIRIDEIHEDKLIILGSVWIKKIENLLYSLQEDNHTKFTFIGGEKFLEYTKERWRKEKNILWEGSYSVDMIAELKKEEALGSSNAFLFLSTNPINIRDLNIINIAIELEKYGVKTYIYDYGMEILYKYKNLSLLKKGLETYVCINEFIEMALEEQNGENK